MPKKIRFESAVHQFLSAAHNVQREFTPGSASDLERWQRFVTSMRFEHLPNGTLRVHWTSPENGCAIVSYRDASFYVRGDTAKHVHTQQQQGRVFSEDDVMHRNQRLFAECVREVAACAGFHVASLP